MFGFYKVFSNLTFKGLHLLDELFFTRLEHSFVTG